MTYRPMIHRAARILLEIVGVAVGGILVLAAIAVWRLSTAPLEARFIRPYVVQAINEAQLGFDVQLTEARIEWHRFRPVVGLHFHGVSFTGQGGAAVGALKDGTLDLSARALLFGRISIVGIDIRQPEITIVRDPDDHFSLRLGASDSTGQNTDFGALLKRFVEQPNDSSAFGRLRRVHLEDGRVRVEDHKLGLVWTAPDVDIDLGRTTAETTAHIDVVLELPHHTARLSGRARYDLAQAKTHLSLDVTDFDAASAAPFAQVLSPMAALALPVSGHVHAVIDRAGDLESGDADLGGEKGQLVLPAYYPTPLEIESIALKLHFANAPQRLTVDRMAVNLGDARLTATGTADFAGPAVAIDTRADIGDIPLPRFDAIWPHGMAVGGRDWVTAHIPDGVIKSGTVHVIASGQVNDPNSIQTTTVEGAFDYSGLEVHYFPALPPIRAIIGHATFDAARMDLSIDTGTLGDLAVSKGVLAITGLDKDESAIEIGLSLQGSLKSLLTILDMPPLGYAHDLGLSPDGVGGNLNLRSNFAFPLVSSLLFRQIAFGVKGTLSGVAASGVVGPRDFSEGALSIMLDKDGMTLDGDARLSGVPVGFNWRESFVASDKVHSRISFHADPTEADRVALALSPPDPVTITGKVAIKGNVTIDRARTTTLDATADITTADLAIEKFGLHKPAGETGAADLSLVFNGDTLRHVPRFKIAANSLNASGTADFAADGSFQHAVVSHLTDRRNDFMLTADAKPGNTLSYAVTLKGATFDAGPVMNSKGSGGPPTHTPRIDLTVALDRVLTGDQTKLDQVSGSASLSGGRLDRADIKAVAGGPLTLAYIPEGGAIALHLAAEDAGAALAGMGLTRGVRGGTLALDGTTDTGQTPWMTSGTLDMRDFRLTNAPIIARLVNAISPTGLFDLLSGQGLGVDRLSAQMDYADGKISFRDGRSAGALGISFEGEVDLDRDRIALKGTVVPADTLNRVVAAIPLIGGMLTGGNRGGLLGWTYSVAGSPNDPQVSVNPLSVFAPGFLRNLFFLGPSQPEPVAEQPMPAAPAPSVNDKPTGP